MSESNDFLNESPSQTAGPYVHIGCTPVFSGLGAVYAEDPGSKMLNAGTRGERITIRGRIYDGNGDALTDALVEIWQADAAGIYPSNEDARAEADPNFNGWGRCPSDMETGEFIFETVRPGQVPYPDGRMQAPHITVWIVARGINVGLHTRVYFDDEKEANAVDPILQSIEDRRRVDTLIAKQEGQGGYRFDIFLQGAQETVFLDI